MADRRKVWRHSHHGVGDAWGLVLAAVMLPVVAAGLVVGAGNEGSAGLVSASFSGRLRVPLASILPSIRFRCVCAGRLLAQTNDWN